MQYTVFYRDSWMSGSHMVSLFKFIRIQTFNLKKWINEFENNSGVEYIFEGWPKQQGETDEEYNQAIKQIKYSL